MTDHKAEALDRAEIDPKSAQVYATLYAADQQRVANMIAWQALTGEAYGYEIRAGLGQ